MKPGHHTLSCYLDGGYRTERQKVPRYGAPSLLCALPGDHESRWWVRGEMHFVHLYFLPEHFTQRYLLPKQKKNNGLKEGEIVVTEQAIRDIIRYYTREAGVRSLEREVS